jgi:GDPmannose 4,6-dehydratase
MAKRALITGITGQDGAYLARLLLHKGYEVVGTSRPAPERNLWRLKALGIENDVRICDLELLEASNILSCIERERPAEIYNLAAQSVVSSSFGIPVLTGDADALGAVRILEAVRKTDPTIRFYQASTSEMFGDALETPQTEATAFRPRSPYGAAKLYAHWMTVNYRNTYDIFACSGILYNHESPLRGLEFVTRKVTSGLAEIALGKRDHIELGNLDASRDWGFAGDYVEGMWKMLQGEAPGDYVLATGISNTVRGFCEAAARAADIEIEWRGKGIDESAIERRSGRTVVKIRRDFYRPAEAVPLVGNSARARREIGWHATMALPDLAEMMVEADLRIVRR